MDREEVRKIRKKALAMFFDDMVLDAPTVHTLCNMALCLYANNDLLEEIRETAESLVAKKIDTSYGNCGFIPFTKEEWDKLQKGPERRKNDCGIPGVSGGYFQNDKMRFGVNCYGTKPSQREIDEVYAKYSDLLHDEEDSEQEKIDEFTRQKDDIFILPFNKSKWNR